MNFRQWLATLNPMYKVRQQRLELVASIKLPHNPDELKNVSYIRLDIHPSIDHYLTHDERLKLLSDAGWIKHLSEDRYYVANLVTQYKVIGEYIKHANLDLRDELRVYNCYLDY
jgi:hypothetical protein